MLSKFFTRTTFITNCDKKTSHTVFRPFFKNLILSVINRESFTNFKLFITMFDKKLLLSLTGITK